MPRITTAEIMIAGPKLIEKLSDGTKTEAGLRKLNRVITRLISGATNPTLPTINKLYCVAVNKGLPLTPQAHCVIRRSEDMWEDK